MHIFIADLYDTAHYVILQALYAIARSAGAVMFESNVRCSFQNGSSGVITEKLYELPLVPDSAVITQDSVAMGFECGAPPEPLVSPWANTRYYGYELCHAISYLSQGNRPPDSKYDTHERPRRSPLAHKQIVRQCVSSVCVQSLDLTVYMLNSQIYISVHKLLLATAHWHAAIVNYTCMCRA